MKRITLFIALLLCLIPAFVYADSEMPSDELVPEASEEVSAPMPMAVESPEEVPADESSPAEEEAEEAVAAEPAQPSEQPAPDILENPGKQEEPTAEPETPQAAEPEAEPAKDAPKNAVSEDTSDKAPEETSFDKKYSEVVHRIRKGNYDILDLEIPESEADDLACYLAGELDTDTVSFTSENGFISEVILEEEEETSDEEQPVVATTGNGGSIPDETFVSEPIQEEALPAGSEAVAPADEMSPAPAEPVDSEEEQPEPPAADILAMLAIAAMYGRKLLHLAAGM